MGRRPNPLVVEFFERGEKLKDNSNRYQHTCKRCSETFPKGRIDTLTSHLLRKCPNVTQEDRQWVFQQLQQNSEKPSEKSSGLVANIRRNNAQSSPAFQQQSALDTLAEVSRHHLDYSSHQSIADQTFIAQLREIAHPQAADVSSLVTSGLGVSPLVQTATAANQQLEAVQAQNIHPAQGGHQVDPQLDDMGVPLQHQLNDNMPSEAETMSWTPGMQSFGNLTIPREQQSSGFGLLQKSTNKKARSHFNDTRRKEVQEIRKRGACIRCRMLKKPCSGETPCSTCKNVDNARLWKGTCLRTRIAEEFTLWSTKLFYARARTEVPAAVHQLEQHRLQGRIEARFFAQSDICMSFSANMYPISSSEVDSGPQRINGADALSGESITLLEEEDDMTEKIELYASQLTQSCIEQERSHFMKATLQRAQALAREEEAKAVESREQQSGRSCYSLQQQLVKNVTELWVLTRLLTSPAEYVLQLRHDPDKPPELKPDHVEQDDQTSKIKDIPAGSTTHQLVLAQLIAAIESRCNKLSKTVMNEIERRLLQRQQASRFATFLSAVILLNCVERMTGLYKSFDTSQDDKPDTFTPPQAAWGNITHPHPTAAAWPLETPPSNLWPQGPHFAALLTTLLRMRALPPKTAQNPDGTLVAIQDFSFHVQVNKPGEEQAKALAEWLDPMGLRVEELVRRRDGEVEVEAGLEGWDLRFIALVLLPERA